MSIFVCGDTHCPHDIHKLNTTMWPEQKMLTKKDILFQLGDFGGVWYPENHPKYSEDLYWQKWLASKNYTLIVIDGNHENHDMIDELPIIEAFGGKLAMKDVPNVGQFFFAKRGEIYTIEGKTFFTMGGAMSQDKENRKEFISWWVQELPSYMEEYNALLNLNEYNNNVDFILSHTGPSSIVYHFLNESEIWSANNDGKSNDPISEFFEEIQKKVKFKEWHFGHLHLDEILVTDKGTFNVHYKNKPLKIV